MCLQNALDCKTCPNGTVSAILAVVVGAVLYLIGIVLGNRIVVDKVIATNSNQIQHRNKVSSTHKPSPQLTRSHAAFEGAETAAKAKSGTVHRFCFVQATHGDLLISSESSVSVSASGAVVSGACQYSISNRGSRLAVEICSLWHNGAKHSPSWLSPRV